MIWRRWVRDADKPGAPVADVMGLGNTFTGVAAVILCKMVTAQVVMDLALSILWGIPLKSG